MIQSVELKNFMIFEHLTIGEFAPVNLIIGEHDTGKSTLLKVLYLALREIKGENDILTTLPGLTLPENGLAVVKDSLDQELLRIEKADEETLNRKGH